MTTIPFDYQWNGGHLVTRNFLKIGVNEAFVQIMRNKKHHLTELPTDDAEKRIKKLLKTPQNFLS